MMLPTPTTVAANRTPMRSRFPRNCSNCASALSLDWFISKLLNDALVDHLNSERHDDQRENNAQDARPGAGQDAGADQRTRQNAEHDRHRHAGVDVSA